MASTWMVLEGTGAAQSYENDWVLISRPCNDFLAIVSPRRLDRAEQLRGACITHGRTVLGC